MLKACGTSRFAYNWGLENWGKMYEEYKKDKSKPCPNARLLRKNLNSIKKEQYPWMKEVSKFATQSAFEDLGIAFKNFFEKRAKYPKFHKKGYDDSFRFLQFKVQDNKLFVPRLGWVKMRESLRFSGKPLSVTVSKSSSNRWYASILVELDQNPYPTISENQGIVGIDLGVKSLATLSTGEIIEGPKPLKKLEKKLKRLCRRRDRRQLGSKRREKAKIQAAKLYEKISNIRHNFLDQLTTWLVNNFKVICIEDLKTKNMMKNHHLAKAISDMGWGFFKSMLKYKCSLRNVRLILVDTFYPSSKTCANCGSILDKLDLSIREWTCPDCGHHHNRDVNAAINLRNLSLVDSTLGIRGIARGEVSSSEVSFHKFMKDSCSQLTSVKRELNIKCI